LLHGDQATDSWQVLTTTEISKDQLSAGMAIPTTMSFEINSPVKSEIHFTVNLRGSTFYDHYVYIILNVLMINKYLTFFSFFFSNYPISSPPVFQKK